ncbi:MAG: hypothetical protein QOE70_4024 [Chthoniobacter sp.]|nr:hypothetical protein [Chthoniobacter sp.]
MKKNLPAAEVRSSLNFLDTPIDGPLVALAFNEKLAAHAFGYNPQPHHRGGSGGQAGNAASESWAKHRDRIKAMWDARDLCTYDWIGGVMGRIALYVVGDLMCKTSTGDPEVDQLVDDYFHNWCGDEEDDDGFTQCDVTGRFRFIKLVQLAFLAMLVDGDHAFVVWLLEEGVKLQSIEADRIGSPVDGRQSETYIGGFTVDPETGRPESIRVFNRTRHGQYNKPVEIEPARFVHIWDPDRSDQYRGVTALLRLLNDCRDIRETIEAERLAIKDQSQFVGAMTSKYGQATANDAAFDGKTVGGTPTQAAQWGKWLRLAEGENVNFLTPSSRPSGAFMQFMQILIRKMAVSLKLSYGFVWDLATLGGVTARVEVRADERQINHWQRSMVTPMRRIRRMVLDHAVGMGLIPSHPKLGSCAWHFGQRIITDVGYEVQNDIQLLNAGLVAADDISTKYSTAGGSLRDVLQRNAAAVLAGQEISSQTRVPLELLAAALWPNATQLLAASNSPPDNPPPPEPGSLEAVGDKGAGQIVDLLSKVAMGQMERESAVQTLITVYGLYPEQAEQICPQPIARPGEDDGSEVGGPTEPQFGQRKRKLAKPKAKDR